jgi:hypothetical protein
VTTILKFGIPQPGLIPWAAKTAARYAWENRERLAGIDEVSFIQEVSEAYEKVREEAAGKGDQVHSSVEAYLHNNDDGLSPKHLIQLQEFLDVSGYTPIHTEVTLIERSIGYAGTVDLIARTPSGNNLILDYKTGKGIWPKDRLQVEALSRCEFILTPEGEEISMPYIDGVGILHLRPMSWWLHRDMDGDSSERNWSAFLGALQVFHWTRLHSSLVFPEERMNAANWRAA